MPRRLLPPIFILLFLIFSFRPVFALSRAYLITEGETLPPAWIPGMNVLVFRKSLMFDYSLGGRVILSSTPDGKGDLRIGDEIIVIRSFDNYFYLATTDCIHFNSIIPPQDITHIFPPARTSYSVTVSIRDRCGRTQEVGPIYLVNTEMDGREPFLELPWDYQAKNLSFTEAALRMTAYFDHEYPLLSSGLIESENTRLSVITYESFLRIKKPYSSHDGYDWAKFAKADYGDPVLAAAAGEAEYRYNNAGGHMIFIDHKNSYQTRYLHLQSEGLIVNHPGERRVVAARQQIGRVGATGNVWPSGNQGAHIHFMVIEDKNHDGNFDDNIPDGVTDPFGWQSEELDPWSTYSFTYAGQQKTGNRSYYLWLNKLDSLKQTVNRDGGTYKTDKVNVVISPYTVHDGSTILIQAAPQVLTENKLASLGAAVSIKILNIWGSLLTKFLVPLNITFSIDQYELDKYKMGSVAIFLSNDGVSWTKEQTVYDEVNKKVTTSVNHLSYFAVMGELKDTIAPTTSAYIDGQTIDGQTYTSDVILSLTATDDEGGIRSGLYSL